MIYSRSDVSSDGMVLEKGDQHSSVVDLHVLNQAIRTCKYDHTIV